MKQVNRRFILAADSHSPSELAHARTEKSALFGGPPLLLLPSPPPAVGPGPLLGGPRSSTPVHSLVA